MPGRTTKEEATQDANMEDAPPSAQVEDDRMEGEEEEEEEEEEIEPQRVKIVRKRERARASPIVNELLEPAN